MKPQPAPVQPTLWEPPPRDCPMCEGRGTVPERVLPTFWFIPYAGTGAFSRCPNCGGSGSAVIPF